MPIIEHVAGESLDLSEGKHAIMFHLPGHCAGCKMALNSLQSKELKDITVELIDAGDDENHSLVEQYGASTAPTIIVFENGNEIGRMAGVKEYMAKNKEYFGI